MNEKKLLLVLFNNYFQDKKKHKIDYRARIYKRIVDKYSNVKVYTFDDGIFREGIYPSRKVKRNKRTFLLKNIDFEFDYMVLPLGKGRKNTKKIKIFKEDEYLYHNIVELIDPSPTFICDDFYRYNIEDIDRKLVKFVSYDKGSFCGKYKHIGPVNWNKIMERNDVNDYTIGHLKQLVNSKDAYKEIIDIYNDRCYNFFEYIEMFTFIKGEKSMEEYLEDMEEYKYYYTFCNGKESLLKRKKAFKYYIVALLGNYDTFDINPECKIRAELRPFDFIPLIIPDVSHIALRKKCWNNEHIRSILEYMDHPILGPHFKKDFSHIIFSIEECNGINTLYIVGEYTEENGNYFYKLRPHRITSNEEELNKILPYISKESRWYISYNNVKHLEIKVVGKYGTIFMTIERFIDNHSYKGKFLNWLFKCKNDNEFPSHDFENVENSDEIIEKIKSYIFKEDITCGICKEESFVWNTACYNDNCNNILCNSCSKEWYSCVPGQKIPIGKLLCPFCKKSPQKNSGRIHGSIFSYDKNAFENTPEEKHVYAMCETCGKVCDTGEMNECNTELEILHYSCESCKIKGNLPIKSCPNCGIKTELADGCNHVKCINCNEHWCYKCGKGGFNHESVYTHMDVEHGGYYN